MNSDTQIRVSTPNGMGNVFATKRHGGRHPVFTFHWSQDPRKDEAWYQKKCAALEPETIAQELDLDYEASGGDTVVRNVWVRASQQLRRHYEERHICLKSGDGVGGLDVGGGGKAKSVFVPRWGSLVGHSEDWSDGDTMNTAGRANELAVKHGCPRLHYDSIGVGLGVTAGLRRMKPTISQGVNVGESPTRTRWSDGKLAKEKFVNLKAELWWTARERLSNAYEHWLFLIGEGGKAHELEDMLFLPDDPAIASQLCLPMYHYAENGKIQIESKKHMIEVRGIPSNDHAEAIIVGLAPIKRASGSRRATGLL
jgi:hypothetical protein